MLAVEPMKYWHGCCLNAEDKESASVGGGCRAGTGKINAGEICRRQRYCAPLDSIPTATRYGYADEPGRWDHWPSGFLFTWPNEEQAEGVLVLDVGRNILLPFKSYARERITLEIDKGFVTRIHGGFEAEYLREYMKYFSDPEVYGISHIGWGLQPRAQWTAMGLHDKNERMCMDACLLWRTAFHRAEYRSRWYA